jgi:uncharacterized membrane protein (UPF0127 family)
MKFNFLRIIFVIFFFFLFLLIAILPSLLNIWEIQKKAEVKINDQYIVAEVVKTARGREKGLGGRKGLGVNEGMLFLFKEKGKYGFWMKGMLFPIDLIWISGSKVVGWETNMQSPQGNEENLRVYYPPEAVDRVLELKAGRTIILNLSKGTEISIKPILPKSKILENVQ